MSESINSQSALGAPVLIVMPQAEDAFSENGVIKGGWLMSQIDIAGAIAASNHTQGRIATIAVPDLCFTKSVFVCDVLKIYATVAKIGKSSITMQLHVFVDRALGLGEKHVPVAQATFVYVAIEKPGVKRLIESRSACRGGA